MSATEEGLLQAIAAEPDDDMHRLVYADWLEENGDSARAELVRVQVARDALHEDHPDRDELNQREKELLRANERHWLADIPAKHRKHFAFVRGLPTRLRITAAQLLSHHQAIRSVTHFDDVRIEKIGGRFREVLDSGALAGVRRLDLSSVDLHDADVVFLADCPDLAGLRALDVSNNPFGVPGWLSLVRSPHLAGLVELSASNSDACLDVALSRPDTVLRLRRLFVQSVQSENFELSRVVAGPACRQLEQLAVSAVNLDAEMKAVGRSEVARTLRHLSLISCNITARGVGHLFASGGGAALESLNLSQNESGPDGVRALVKAPLGNLKFLDLGYMELGNEGLKTLCTAGLRSLISLSLWSCDVEAAGLRALASSPLLSQLQALELGFNFQSDESGFVELVRSSAARGLRNLGCHWMNLDTQGTPALAASPNLPRLRRLHFDGNHIGPDGVAALIASPYLQELRELSIASNDLKNEGAEALLASDFLDRLVRVDLKTNGISQPLRARLKAKMGSKEVHV